METDECWNDARVDTHAQNHEPMTAIPGTSLSPRGPPIANGPPRSMHVATSYRMQGSVGPGAAVGLNSSSSTPQPRLVDMQPTLQQGMQVSNTQSVALTPPGIAPLQTQSHPAVDAWSMMEYGKEDSTALARDVRTQEHLLAPRVRASSVLCNAERSSTLLCRCLVILRRLYRSGLSA